MYKTQPGKTVITLYIQCHWGVFSVARLSISRGAKFCVLRGCWWSCSFCWEHPRHLPAHTGLALSVKELTDDRRAHRRYGVSDGYLTPIGCYLRFFDTGCMRCHWDSHSPKSNCAQPPVLSLPQITTCATNIMSTKFLICTHVPFPARRLRALNSSLVLLRDIYFLLLDAC